jgi:Tfp pilus assembly protein PilN
MIKINLLPEELRDKVIKPVKPAVAVSSATKPGLKELILVIPLVFVLLIIGHIVFVFLGMAQSSQLNALKGRWERMAPERKALENFNSEYALLSDDSREMQRLLNDRVNWAEKLNKLSLVLPSGVWFNVILATNKDFSLGGSVVSLDKQEVSLLKQLIDSLKNDPSFFKDFNTLELGSIQKRTIGKFEVTDFTLIGTLKVK